MKAFASFAVVFSLFFSLFGGTCGNVCLFPPCGDFSIAPNPVAVTSNAGAAAASTITVSPNGLSSKDLQNFSLAVDGTPAGASASFGPTSIAGGGTETTTLTLQPGSAAPGTYNLTVTGTIFYSVDLSLKHTATVAWTIA